MDSLRRALLSAFTNLKAKKATGSARKQNRDQLCPGDAQRVVGECVVRAFLSGRRPPRQEKWNKACQNTPRLCYGNELLMPAAGPQRRLQVGVPGGCGGGGANGGGGGLVGNQEGWARIIFSGSVLASGDGVLFENLPPKA